LNLKRTFFLDNPHVLCYNQINQKTTWEDKNMKIYTTDYITGKNLETLGLVEGSTVQSKHIGRDLAASFKTIVGGELKGYTEMMNEARKVATARMIEQAEAMGADAIIAVRYSSSAVMDGAAEIMAYGTAVKFI
jgi:uncharacterized protein YbjQ (UPF0145 family)